MLVAMAEQPRKPLRGRTVRCGKNRQNLTCFYSIPEQFSHCCCLAKYGGLFSQCLLHDIILSTSSPLTHFLSLHGFQYWGYGVLHPHKRCTRSCQSVETAQEGFVQLEHYQDAVKVVNPHSKIDSTSFTVPSSHSPPHCSPSPRSRSGGWFSGWSWESTFTVGCCARAVCTLCRNTPEAAA